VYFCQASWEKELENPLSVSSITISFGPVVGVVVEVELGLGVAV
jgi:hypothetical protein